MTAGTRHVPLVAAAGLVAAVACGRPPEAFVCPDVDEGELVVSELRGPNGHDKLGQWIELYNAGDDNLDLHGLRITIVPLDGTAEDTILVRTDPVELAVGDYAVLGRLETGSTEHIDYLFAGDLETDLPAQAAIEVEACGVLIDEAVYLRLPDTGTLALDGTVEPDAEANDDALRWCDDMTEPPEPQTGVEELPGSPGEANPPCP